MSILIKGMDKPKGCWLCTFQIVDSEGGANGCVLDHSIQSADWDEDAIDDCPIIEIPEDNYIVQNLLREIEYEVHKDEFDY